jgi:quercetin dioxygenase-like cupin family protein
VFRSADNDGFKPMTAGVHLRTLVFGEQTVLTEVRLDKGAVVPEHQHAQEQTGYLVSGSLRMVSPEGASFATPGASWTFPAGTPHGAEALADTVVVEVFSPLRQDLLP